MSRMLVNRVKTGKSRVVTETVLRPLASAVLLALSSVVVQADELNYIAAQGNTGGSHGMGGAAQMAISPDNKTAYIAASVDKGVGAFTQSAGVVSQLGFYPSQDSQNMNFVPLAVVVSGDGKSLYAAVNGFSGSSVLGYGRAADGTLSAPTFYGDTVIGNDIVKDLIVSDDGRNVYAVGSNSVFVFTRNASTGELINLQKITDGLSGVDGLAGAASVRLSPDGKHVYVAGSNDNAVAVFARSTINGQLSFIDVQRIAGLGGARGVALSQDGTNVYVASPADNALSVFKRDSVTGKLSFIEKWQNSATVDGLNGITAVTVSPNGSRVYASSSEQNTVSVFRRSLQDGKLEFVEVQKNGVNGVAGLQGAVSLTLNSTGAYLFVASPADGTGQVAAFKTANTVPKAVADAADATAGAPITLYVLANDTDPDNDALRVSGTDSKSKQGGIVAVNSDSSISYTAPSGFVGTDTFNYFVSDVRDATPQVGVVTINVTAAANGSVPISSPTNNSTAGEDNGGGGGIDAWMGLILLGAAISRRRVFAGSLSHC